MFNARILLLDVLSKDGHLSLLLCLFVELGDSLSFLLPALVLVVLVEPWQPADVVDERVMLPENLQRFILLRSLCFLSLLLKLIVNFQDSAVLNMSEIWEKLFYCSSAFIV